MHSRVSVPDNQLVKLLLLTIEACLPEHWWSCQHPRLDSLTGQAEAQQLDCRQARKKHVLQ